MRRSPSDRTKGILCIVASAFGFAAMAFFVRLCDEYGAALSCFQKGFFRNAVALAIAACAFAGEVRCGRRAAWLRLDAAAWGSLAARCLFGSVGIFANFYALSRIPIAEGMALNKTAPFFTVLGAWLLLRERPSLRQLAGVAAAFVGAMLVVRPGFRALGTGAALWGLAGGLCAGAAYAFLRDLGRRKVDGPFIVLCFSAFSCLASVPFVLADPRPMTAAQGLILLGAGAGAALGQFGITAAYRFAAPRQIASWDYTNVVFTALFGLAFLGQVPAPVGVAGFAVIVLASRLSHSASGKMV